MVLKDCSRCLVYTPKGRRLGEARVVHTKDSVSLFFDDEKLKDQRLRARVDFYDEQTGLIAAVCELVMRRNPGFPEGGEPWMAECSILDIKDVVQRQRDIRAKVDIPIQCSSKKHGEFCGTIENLSAGGMHITTVQLLNKQEEFTFNYRFRTLERRFEAKTLWVKRAGGGRYCYGCNFLHMTNGAEAAVRSFVFKKLLERQKDRE